MLVYVEDGGIEDEVIGRLEDRKKAVRPNTELFVLFPIRAISHEERCGTSLSDIIVHEIILHGLVSCMILWLSPMTRSGSIHIL